MQTYFEEPGILLYCGDALETLRTFPEALVHCCVTSPPYWGLRDYGTDGQLGLEATPAEYVEKMVAVFAEVKRVLRDDGTLWLNMGDCYATGAGKVGECPGGGERGETWKNGPSRYRDSKRRPAYNGHGNEQPTRKGSNRAQRGDGNNSVPFGPMTQPNRLPLPGLKPKDLVGMPWMLAFALRADGWYLRSDIIWSKPNPMPESVTDRPTKAHEYLFLLSKSERYFYDAEAIREPFADDRQGCDYKFPDGWDTSKGEGGHGNVHRLGRVKGLPARERNRGGRTDGFTKPNGIDPSANGGRNKRSVWEVNPQPFPEAHFATFPEDLVRPCVLAGCPAGGTVLDPFIGSGTTALVARQNGCQAIGVELNAEYLEIAKRRLSQQVLEFSVLDS